jgi:hypothetical protein
MKAMDCGKYDELFTHIDPDDGHVTHFNATRIKDALPTLLLSGSAELLTVEIDPAFITYIIQHRGIEPWKVERLVAPYLNEPIIGVQMPDGSVLTIDGHHRLVRWRRAGKKTYQIYVVAYEASKPFQVDDIPAALVPYLTRN